MDNNEIEEEDFDTFRENVKLENLTSDYYPNLATNGSVEKVNLKVYFFALIFLFNSFVLS